VLRPHAARAAPVTLKLHHAFPPVADMHRRLLVPWAQRVEAGSGGGIRIDIYPALQLGGPPAGLHDQVREGVADIAWTHPADTPGRFPATEVFELPFVADRRGIINARAAAEYARSYLADDMSGVKLLSFATLDHSLIHATRQVVKLEDLAGLRLWHATPLAGEALRALGAVPVALPLPELPQSLADKTLDGAVTPWDIVPTLKLHELTKHHADIPGTPAFSTASYALIMNASKYESLPDTLRKAIDDTTGLAFTGEAAGAWDAAGAEVLATVKKRGNVITTISGDEKARWVKATEPVIDAWLKTADKKGRDRTKLLDAARIALMKHRRA
jgi:TRAP-type C4-dicarboxylate transport system substrate-binding protein